MNHLLEGHLENDWRIAFSYHAGKYLVMVQRHDKHGDVLFSSMFESGVDSNSAFLQANSWMDKQEMMYHEQIKG